MPKSRKMAPSKVTVTNKTVKDLTPKPGKAAIVKGGIVGYPKPIGR